jgi:uncharacterized integral membrane protein
MRREHQDDPASDPIAEHHRELQRSRQSRVAKLLVALFLVIVFIVFIIQNSDRTKIDYVFFSRETRLIWIMLACGIVGGIVGYLVGRPGKQVRFRRKKPTDQKKP